MRALGECFRSAPPEILYSNVMDRRCTLSLVTALTRANSTGPFCEDLSSYPSMWTPTIALRFIEHVVNKHLPLFSQYLHTRSHPDFINWRSHLHSDLHSQIDKTRPGATPYDINSLPSLLLFIRNMSVHFHQKLLKERRALGCHRRRDYPECFMNFFDDKFPTLRGILFNAINDSPIWRAAFKSLVPFKILPNAL